MLSRIAESLYWLGRYLERADDTARLLDVNVHRLLADAGHESVGASLLAAMGLSGTAEAESVDLWRATELLAYDADNPSSVAGSLRLARGNARGLRETLATDVWEAINRTHNELEPQIRAARALGPHLFFRWVKERVALIGGLIDTIVLHDYGWRFLTVGRCLERVDMTARLLRAVTSSEDPSRWSSVLISCGAYDAFLRLHGGEITRTRSLSMLLQAEDLPRSVLYALDLAETSLREVAVVAGHPDNAVRVLGRVRAELSYTDPEDLTRSVDDTLTRLQDACREADALVTGRYFRRADVVEWTAEAI